MNFLLCLVSALCVSASAENRFLTKNREFSASLYKEFAKNGKNFLASPYAVQEFLALNIRTSKDKVHQNLERPTIEEIPTFDDARDYHLQAYPKIYLRQEHYPADNESFQITRVFQESRVDFQAAWPRRLEPVGNRFAFYVKEHQKVFVEAVQNTYLNAVYSKHLFAESYALEAKFLQLALEGNDSYITFALPNEKEGLSKLEANIENVLKFDNYGKEHVRYTLPKLNINHEINLKQLFEKVDLKSGPLGKDTLAAEQINVVVTERIHTASLSLDKEGFNGGKIHNLKPSPVGNSGRIEDLPKFTADHPFIFYVKIRGVIVFVGRVANPSN